MQPMTEIGMALFAHLTATTRLRRIDRHSRPWPERLKVAVIALGANRLHHAGKFMSQNQRGLYHGVADACILIRMQIAAAHAHRCNPQQRLSRSWRIRLGDTFYAQVSRAMQSGCQHCVNRFHLNFAFYFRLDLEKELRPR